MNKLLPILLVVVLSGCAMYSIDDYGGVRPPYTPDSRAGTTMIGNPEQRPESWNKDNSNKKLTEEEKLEKSIDEKNAKLRELNRKIECMESNKRMESMGMKVLITCR